MNITRLQQRTGYPSGLLYRAPFAHTLFNCPYSPPTLSAKPRLLAPTVTML